MTTRVGATYSTEEMAYEDNHHTFVLARFGIVQRLEYYRFPCSIIDFDFARFVQRLIWLAERTADLPQHLHRDSQR
jgi:hypothetical protein